MSRDVVDAQRIDVVQRPKIAFGVPPAMRQRLELGDFRLIDVFGHEASRVLVDLVARRDIMRSAASRVDQRLARA